MSAAQKNFVLFNETFQKPLKPTQAREFLLDNEYLSDIQFILGPDENEIFYGNF
jgi:cysteinyl-tRNA synthetase